MQTRNQVIDECIAALVGHDDAISKLQAIKSPVSVARPSIEELEKILQREDETPIRILPDGSVEVGDPKVGERKPLTMRENLGGEYGIGCYGHRFNMLYDDVGH